MRPIFGNTKHIEEPEKGIECECEHSKFYHCDYGDCHFPPWDENEPDDYCACKEFKQII